MKLKLLTATVLGIATTLSLNVSMKKAHADNEVKFICADSYDSQSGTSLPTTFAWTSRGKIAIVRWQSEEFADVGFSSQQRCEAVSPRFQEAYDNNTINLLTNGTMNNQRVICTSSKYEGGCNTLLITLRPEDDSLKVLNNLKQVLNGQQVGPIKQNADVSQIYYEVDIENFLETAPIE